MAPRAFFFIALSHGVVFHSFACYWLTFCYQDASLKFKNVAERDEKQIGFRVREETQRDDLKDALKKQVHVANATLFFQSVIDALKKASDKGELIEWPVKFVTRPKE